MTDRYRRSYAMLKRVGHSPTAALRVLLDAHRGEKHALRWVRFMRRIDRGWQEAD